MPQYKIGGQETDQEPIILSLEDCDGIPTLMAARCGVKEAILCFTEEGGLVLLNDLSEDLGLELNDDGRILIQLD